MESLANSLLDDISTAIVSYNLYDNTIQYANSKATSIMRSFRFYDSLDPLKINESLSDLFKNNLDTVFVNTFSNNDKTITLQITIKTKEIDGKSLCFVYLDDEVFTKENYDKLKEENLQLNNLLNNSPRAICLFKWDGSTIKPLVIGEVFTKLLGISNESIMKSNVSEFFKAIHPEELFMFSSELRLALYETKKLLGVYKLYNFTDNIYHSVLIDAIFIPQNDGFQFINACFTDVSSEREKSRLLNEANAKIKLIYEHIPGAIFSCKFDKNWTLIYANDEFFSFLGYNTSSFRKIHNNKLFGLMFDEDRMRLEDITRNKVKIQSHNHILLEMRFKTSTGAVKWVSLSGEVLEDEDANPYCYFVFVDITEFKERQLAQESEHRILSEMLLDLPCGILHIDLNNGFNVSYANSHAVDYLLYDSLESIRSKVKSISDIFKNADENFAKNFLKASKSNFNVSMICSNHDVFKTTASAFCLDSINTGVVYFVFTKR